MPRHHALLLGLAALVVLGMPPSRALAQPTTFVGPTRILLVDADTVLTVVTREWLSAGTRNEEKLLRYGVRMKYWYRKALSMSLPPVTATRTVLARVIRTGTQSAFVWTAIHGTDSKS